MRGFLGVAAVLLEVAAHHRLAVLINAIDEVLAGHADHAAFPVMQVSVIDKTPLLHRVSLAVRLYCLGSEGIVSEVRLPL